MDEACACAHTPTEDRFLPLWILFRGADSVRELEQICLRVASEDNAANNKRATKVMKKVKQLQRTSIFFDLFAHFA